jgi:hypothetical protein
MKHAIAELAAEARLVALLIASGHRRTIALDRFTIGDARDSRHPSAHLSLPQCFPGLSAARTGLEANPSVSGEEFSPERRALVGECITSMDHAALLSTLGSRLGDGWTAESLAEAARRVDDERGEPCDIEPHRDSPT